MILTYPGNKRKIAKKIIAMFPKHSLYIEPFFGAGGVFFNKPLANHNFLNDKNEDVANLYWVVKHQKNKLIKEYKMLPTHKSIFNYWKGRKEKEPIYKALRFLFLSNFSYLGRKETLKFSTDNTKQMFLNHIDFVFDKIQNVKFSCSDFESFINKELSFRRETDRAQTLIYCDPPYLDTINKYEAGVWTEEDLHRLIKTLFKSKTMFCISEFYSEKILNISKEHKLNLTKLNTRQNLKNRQTEIVLSNFLIQKNLWND